MRLIELDRVDDRVEKLLSLLVYQAILENLFDNVPHFVVPFFEECHGLFVGFLYKVNCFQALLESHAFVVDLCQ